MKKLTDQNSNNRNRKEKLVAGVDIVNVNRIKKIISNKREKFYNKIFTKEEIEYIEKKGHKATTISGLFAAKEATSKALGTGIGHLGWKDLQTLHEESGKPYINFSEKGNKIIKDLGLVDIELTISHEKDYAIAFVIGYMNN